MTQKYDEAGRADIQQGLDTAKALANQTSIFFANRAEEQKEAQKKADQAKPELEDAKKARDKFEKDSAEYKKADEKVQALTKIVNEPQRLDGLYGATSPTRLVLTAINGAAGSNVAGSASSFVQAAAVNVIQGLAVQQVKHIADSLLDKDGKPTEKSEIVRAALQAVIGCAGQAASGGDCGSAAAGASASVVVNYLLNEFTNSAGKKLTLEEQEARTNLVGTLVGAISSAAGLDAPSAVSSARIETENNNNACGTESYLKPCVNPGPPVQTFHSFRNSQKPGEQKLYQNFMAAARALGYSESDIALFDPVKNAEMQVRTSAALWLHYGFDVPFSVIEDPDIFDAYVAAVKEIEAKDKAIPGWGKVKLEEAGGSHNAMLNHVAYDKYHEQHPWAAGFYDVVDVTNIAAHGRLAIYFVGGTVDGTIDMVKSGYNGAKSLYDDPMGTAGKVLDGALYIINNSVEVAKAMGAEGEKFVKAVAFQMDAFNRALLLGDVQGQKNAAYALGKMVGPLVVGAVTGTAAGKLTLNLANKTIDLAEDGLAAARLANKERKAKAAAEQAAEKARLEAQRTGNTPNANADSEAGFAGDPYDRISTAKAGQSAFPRTLNEKMFWDEVVANPKAGKDIELEGDSRFLRADGWQKMHITRIMSDGRKMIIHYQYNTKTGKVSDMKLDSPKI